VESSRFARLPCLSFLIVFLSLVTYCAMHAFVIFAAISVASGHRLEVSLIESASKVFTRPPPKVPLGKAGAVATAVIKNGVPKANLAKPPAAVGRVIKTAVKPHGLIAPRSLVPNGRSKIPGQNSAINNAKPLAGKDGVMKAMNKPTSSVMKAIMEPTVNNPGDAQWANNPMSQAEAEAIAKARKEGNGGVSPEQEVEVEESHSHGTQSDMMGKSIVNEIQAGAKGSGIVTIEGRELHFGTEDAKAAIESLNWVPSTKDANDILKKHECWPGQPPCDTPRTAMDWVADYSSSYKYAKNVCRATRGDVAEVREQAPAACFDSRFVTTEQATACSFNYGVALSAALALQPNMGVQELYRGCKQPVELLQKLQGLAGGRKPFVFPGVSSFSANRGHASKFMELQGKDTDVKVMYHIKTDRARSVEGAMGDEFKKRGKMQEWESVMPPGQTMEVVSVEPKSYGPRVTQMCYYVTLQDAAPPSSDSAQEMSMD